MNLKRSQADRIARWQRDFRCQAEADKLAVLRDQIRRLRRPLTLSIGPKLGPNRAPRGERRVRAAELSLESTIRVVEIYCVYLIMEGRRYGHFLSMQTYDPEKAPSGAVYAVTFELCNMGLARVLVDEELHWIDFADLWGHPGVSYQDFWISSIDGEDVDMSDLESKVTDDLRYDYAEDELDVEFVRDNPPGILYGWVQEHRAR